MKWNGPASTDYVCVSLTNYVQESCTVERLTKNYANGFLKL